MDLEQLIDLNCDPELTAEQLADARKLVHLEFGPYAELVLRACGRASVARRQLTEAVGALERLRHGAQLRGIVTGLHNGRVQVAVGGGERVLERPHDMALGIGQTVLVDAEGRSLVAASDYLVGGVSFVFSESLEDRLALVRPLRETAEESVRQLALVSDGVDLAALAPGDHVLGWLVDGGNTVLVTRHLGPVRRSVPDDVGAVRAIAREEIVGLEAVMAEADLHFLVSDEPAFVPLLERLHGGTVGRTFHGPAGCGKTLVARYYVAMVRARGGRAIYRTGSQYLAWLVGQGAAAVRADFADLEAAFAETGVRPLLVIDELEAIALDRGLPGILHGGFIDVLDELLGQISRTSARVIGISNVGNRVLDAALTRDGRIPLLRFPPTLAPEPASALATRSLDGLRLVAEASEFGETLRDLVWAPAGPLAELLRVQLADGRVLRFGAADFITGAAIADGIVRPLLARVVQRDLGAGRRTPRPVTLEEFRTATLRYFAERAAGITRDNVRAVLPERIPDDQAVAAVERVAIPEAALRP